MIDKRILDYIDEYSKCHGKSWDKNELIDFVFGFSKIVLTERRKKGWVNTIRRWVYDLL